MKARAILMLVLLLVLTACRPPVDKAEVSSSNGSLSGLKASIEFDKDAKLGPAEIRVYLLKDNKAVSGAEVKVTGDMTHAGMVPVISKAIETENGLYQTKDFEFTMAGDWILTVDIKASDGEKLSLEKRLTVKGR